jgi:hypothetical protein
VSSSARKITVSLSEKKYLEKVEDMVLAGNTEEIFNESCLPSGGASDKNQKPHKRKRIPCAQILIIRKKSKHPNYAAQSI